MRSTKAVEHPLMLTTLLQIIIGVALTIFALVAFAAVKGAIEDGREK